jgi:hypothetical protein
MVEADAAPEARNEKISGDGSNEADIQIRRDHFSDQYQPFPSHRDL